MRGICMIEIKVMYDEKYPLEIIDVPKNNLDMKQKKLSLDQVLLFSAPAQYLNINVPARWSEKLNNCKVKFDILNPFTDEEVENYPTSFTQQKKGLSSEELIQSVEEYKSIITQRKEKTLDLLKDDTKLLTDSLIISTAKSINYLSDSISVCDYAYRNADKSYEKKDALSSIAVLLDKDRQRQYIMDSAKIYIDFLLKNDKDAYDEFKSFIDDILEDVCDYQKLSSQIKEVVKQYTEQPLDDIIRIISPTNTLVRKTPIDKLSQAFMNPNAQELEKQTIAVNEVGKKDRARNKSGEQLISHLAWECIDEKTGQIIKEHFSKGEIQVLNAAISEFAQNGEKQPFITPDVLYRTIVGDTSSKKTVSPEWYNVIDNAMAKARRITLTIDITEVCKAYHGGTDGAYLEGVVLPNQKMTVILNGKKAEAYRILAQSPIYQQAIRKNNKILTYEKRLLNFGTNTVDFSVIKTQIVEQITIIKNNKWDGIIKYDWLWEHCDLRDVSVDKRNRLLKLVRKYMDNLKEIAFIKTWKEIKKNRKLYSLEFTY